MLGNDQISQANRHKRGYSALIGGSNASPASHLNNFGSPATLNKQLNSPDLATVLGMNINGIH